MEECPNCGKMLRSGNDVDAHFKMNPKCRQAWEEENQEVGHKGVYVNRKHTDDEYHRALGSHKDS
jgi:hypothetical protein